MTFEHLQIKLKKILDSDFPKDEKVALMKMEISIFSENASLEDLRKLNSLIQTRMSLRNIN